MNKHKGVGNMQVQPPKMFQFGLFLLLQKPNDRDHKVRLALGNGLRADVWKEFVRRFGDININEFYASTEGNIGFMNYTRKIGAVGRVNYLQKVSILENEGICSQLSVMGISWKLYHDDALIRIPWPIHITKGGFAHSLWQWPKNDRVL